ncbi:AI-2E family transporter [Maritimibacter sp. HL-12]|jgi:predicted PurR-regulated permease PerM|uniref:AI-2E family transporter n=1 Tax=Maritimibacter sp. HL-12 TaxID=1162418 RepID=UPI000A0F28DF|nr:AI-2E family transporter [Maritimibacter sp. HL-12]SMH52242.1 Predicted PurR-regulated permease PerM [Maritimibacter sp. HL-12]
MALPVGTQMKYWGLAAALFLAVLWFLGDVLLPFVLGGAVAYFLDPVADRLERLGLNRILATVVITLIAVLVFAAAALLVVPTLVNQSVALVNVAPSVARDMQAFLTERFPSSMDEGSILRQSLDTLGETIKERGGELIDAVVSSARNVLSVVLLIVIVPVVAFYLLLDWDRMTAAIDDLLPRDHAPVIRRLAKQIDETLASFIRGQVTVGLILGTYYAIALMLIGLDFGVVIGFVAGIISFIPYVGALVGGVLAIGLALFQFWGEWWMIGGVVAIFMAGQFFEGNILSPNLVGSSVGLHPVWLIFALAAFGSLFGFVGMLVAVPVAAALGVIVRFLAERYKEGRLYKGLSDNSLTIGPDDDTPADDA